jgi:hypothetical protein
MNEEGQDSDINRPSRSGCCNPDEALLLTAEEDQQGRDSKEGCES